MGQGHGPLDGVDTSERAVRDRVLGHPRRPAGRGVPPLPRHPVPSAVRRLGGKPPPPSPARRGGQRSLCGEVGEGQRGGAPRCVRSRRPRQGARRGRNLRRGDLRRWRLGHRSGVAPFGAGLAAGQITDPALAFAGARAHNRWLTEFCATNPTRRAGVALVPIIHDVDESVREIEALAGTPGIRGVMIPTMWHDKPSYGHPRYEPVWAACAEAGLVVHTHSGEGDWPAYNENLAQFVMEVPFWTHRPLWQLLLSGAFDRHPGLKYVPTECGSWWIGDLLWKADTTFGANPKVKKLNSRTKGLIKRLPSEYFGTNVFIGASTMSREELRRRHRNGIDALMWGTDYPHPEGSWPHTVERLETDFRDVSVEDTRLLLGLNAVRCYGLDLTALERLAAGIGPTPTELHQDLSLRTPPDAIREARWWFEDYAMAYPGGDA
ncbi:MAG: amidohydrolase family protein [Microthrixaceae bacterium]